VLNRLINFSSAVNDIKPRIWTWGSGLAGAIEKPVAGWGVENFATPFDKYYNPRHYGIESFFDRTHNIFLEYSISGGLLVLLPWLAIFFFYYRELRKRAKDMWYSVLFVVPIAYLIQGFFLFDTLPIYLAFFAFLVLFLNSDENEIHLSPNENSALVGANIATATILTLGVIGLLYYTAFLPFQKNRLIVNALLLQNTLAAQAAAGVKQTINPVEIVDAFHQALAFKSPIGQEEAVAMYQKFMLNIVENASQNEKVTSSPQARQEMKQVLDDVNKVFDDNLPIYAGLKQHFINGGINMRAGLAFNLPEYLARGKKTFTESLEKSPTRLEFIRVLIQLAQLQNDKEALEKWARRANLYRPDIFKLEELLPATSR
jgi:4-amino-4-deoxy-L-arabinose transferase-like glycosyltransferase